MASGDFAAVQVIEYIGHAPVGIIPLKFYEGDARRTVIRYFQEINQGK